MIIYLKFLSSVVEELGVGLSLFCVQGIRDEVPFSVLLIVGAGGGNHDPLKGLRVNFWKKRALFVFAVIWISALCAYGQTALPADERATFAGSIKEVPVGHATITRSQMTAVEGQERLDFSVALKMRGFAELEARISRGEIISVSEMVAKYYPTAADSKMVEDWLRLQGFAVQAPRVNSLCVFANGTLAQTEKAFGTKFGAIRYAGVESLSALKAPSMPSAVAAPVLGINGLQPYLHPLRHSRGVPRQLQTQFQNSPPFTIGEIAKAYGADTLTVNGTGQKIAIVIDSFPADSDLTTFWSSQGIPQSIDHIEKVQVVPGALASPSGEETLDTEWTSGMAPGARIRIYATLDLSFVHIDAAFERILSDLPGEPTLHQLSISLGTGETGVPTAQMQTDDQYFASMAAAGLTVFVSSGDGGSSPGESGQDHSGPIQVETFANDPNVTAVGGTSLFLNSATGIVSSETAWFDGGGGVSQVFARPPWQKGLGVPAGSTRLVPDVALAADPNTGSFVVLNGGEWQFGGTSWSAPSWAAFCARLNQARASYGAGPIGLLGPSVYPLIGTSSFRDITTGSNGPNGIYNAGPGYDLCTGLGVPNVAQLVQQLAGIVNWKVVGTMDVNGDGKTDILMQSQSTGQLGSWLMNGAGQVTGSVAISNPGVTDWKVVGTADLNGDGKTDIIWQSQSTGQVAAWLMDGAGHAKSIIFISSGGVTDWKVVGTADLNGDGKTDILWQSQSTGQVAAWLMDGAGHAKSVRFLTNGGVTDWKVVGTADLNSDGKADILWQSRSTGQIAAWIMDGAGHAQSNVLLSQGGVVDWKIAGTMDVNGDGKTDILWQSASNGWLAAWLMNGAEAATGTLLITGN